MHWRYRLRKQQLLDECDVPPEVFQGGIERLAEFARPFAECLVRQEQTGPRPDLPGRARLRPEAQDRRVDRLPPRPGAARPPALRRLLDLGPPAPAARAGRPGGPRDRHPRRGDRLRPLGLRQEGRRLGRACSGNGSGGSGRWTTARSASSWPTPRTTSMPWSMSGSTCPRRGPRTARGASGAASPRRCATGRGTSWRWRCSRRPGRCCRTAGSPATTRWAARRGSGPSCVA